jgi:hypothetical protein
VVVEETKFTQATAGLVCRGAVQARFTKCIFEKHKSVGVDLLGDEVSVVFDRCQIAFCEIAGIQAGAGAKAHIASGSISECGRIGIIAAGSTLALDNFDLMSCSEVGLALFEGAKVLARRIRIHDNQHTGCQVVDKESTLRLIECGFRAHPNAAALVALDGKVQCEKCTFRDSMQPHCDVRQGATLYLGKCLLGPTTSGSGVQVHEGATLLLEDTEVTEEPKFAIVIGEESTVKALSSSLKGCGTGGVYSIGGSAEFEKCTFAQNGKVGLKCQGGSALILDCDINSHTCQGVLLQSGADFSEYDTKWSDNSQDVVVAD